VGVTTQKLRQRGELKMVTYAYARTSYLWTDICHMFTSLRC